MVISNEPGYYRAGCFGIRHENLLLVTEAEVSAGGDQPMYGFEALTLVPFALAPLVLSVSAHWSWGWGPWYSLGNYWWSVLLLWLAFQL